MNTCVLCGEDPETVQHLFFSFPYSTYIWSLCKLNLGMDRTVTSLQDEALNIKEKFSKKKRCYALARLVIGGAVWHLWKGRNSRIYQQKMQNRIMVF